MGHRGTAPLPGPPEVGTRTCGRTDECSQGLQPAPVPDPARYRTGCGGPSERGGAFASATPTCGCRISTAGSERATAVWLTGCCVRGCITCGTVPSWKLPRI